MDSREASSLVCGSLLLYSGKPGGGNDDFGFGFMLAASARYALPSLVSRLWDRILAAIFRFSMSNVSMVQC